jgi:hypothetical protein
MSGTIPLSMTQQFDVYGQPLAGGQLFIIQAGTVATPQNPYQDAALTLLLPNPITLDAAGRIPQFFLADGYIKIRLTDVNGVVQLAADGILVIGPSAGGGGGSAGVDPTTVMQTGDIKPRYDIAVLAGFVRCNGRSIGSASSGATELADPSAQALFNYLWNKDTSLVVTPSRGASSAADWAANKQIALPDFRGYALGGLDGMGASLAGRLTSGYFGAASADVLGAVGGSENFALAAAQLPSITPIFTGTNAVITVQSNVNNISYDTAPTAINVGPGSAIFIAGVAGHVAGKLISDNSNIGGYTPAGTIAPFGGGQAHRTIGPRKLITIYMKL